MISPRPRFTRLLVASYFVYIATFAFAADRSFSAQGLVLKVDSPHKLILISTDAIPGYMDAMSMPFSVRSESELQGIRPGAMVDFTLVVNSNSSYIENLRIHVYQGLEPDPLTARRLKLMNRIANPSAVKPLNVGDAVPDFSLIDQQSDKVSLSEFRGRVVALNFVYTRCALPNFCYRTANNFGVVQRRLGDQTGRDIVFLTVTFDPVHDQPDVLAKYATTWHADPHTWHFLTGPPGDVRRVCDLFGEDFFQDEGLMNHSLHTAIIDRNGKLVANLEGNQFNARQLGDLIETVLAKR